MATRKQAREAVVQLLYARELGNDNALSQAAFFLNEQKIRNKQQEFASSLLFGVCEHEEIIVQIMNIFLKTWNIERLGVVEKSILKLGIYELLQTDTQKAVVINEAIELTKSFGLHDAFRLVNGVLDSIAKTSMDEIAEMIKNYKENTEQISEHTVITHDSNQTSKELLENSSKEKIESKKNIHTKNDKKYSNKEKKPHFTKNSKKNTPKNKQDTSKQNKNIPHTMQENMHTKTFKIDKSLIDNLHNIELPATNKKDN